MVPEPKNNLQRGNMINPERISARDNYFSYLEGKYFTDDNAIGDPNNKPRLEIDKIASRTFHRLAAAEILWDLRRLDFTEVAGLMRGGRQFLPTPQNGSLSSGSINESLKYVYKIASEDSIYPPIKLPVSLRKTEEGLVESIIEADTLPENLVIRLRIPDTLPDVVRTIFIARYLSYAYSEMVTSKTGLWEFSVLNPEASEALGSYDFPETFFYNDPPVDGSSLATRNNILVSGTNVETRDISEVLGQQNGMTIAVAGYDYVSRLGSFWSKFFGVDQFLDDKEGRTKPSEIVATGSMRNYNRYGGETVGVVKRLEEIAKIYQIPIKFIPTFAP